MTIIVKLCRGGGIRSRAFLGFLALLLTASHACSQSANISFNSPYVRAGQDVTFTVELYCQGSGPLNFEIRTPKSPSEFGQVGPGNHHFHYTKEATYDIEGDFYWVEVYCAGEKVEENAIPIIRITGFEAFANGQQTWAVAVGQRADFKVFLNNYMGNGPAWAPNGLFFENVDDQCGGWAYRTWHASGLETVGAYGISLGASLSLYVVDARIKSVTFTGADFAPVKKDSDGQIYAEPHYSSDNPEYRPPVQYRRGSRPTMNLVFEVLPPEYPGSLYIRALSSLETPTAHSLACAGVAQFANVQTSDSLQDSVGYNPELDINWEYSVAGDEFYFAGNSSHKIYRTLGIPDCTYHTVVDIACNIDATSDISEILDSIWLRFSGTNCVNAAGDKLFYWKTAQASQNLGGLLSTRDGSCVAWCYLLYSCWKVHRIEANSAYVQLTRPGEAGCIGFSVYANIQGQNGIPVVREFTNHKVAFYGDYVYDASYGKRYKLSDYASENAWIWNWENMHVDKFIYNIEPIYRSDDKTIRQMTVIRGNW